MRRPRQRDACPPQRGQRTASIHPDADSDKISRANPDTTTAAGNTGRWEVAVHAGTAGFVLGVLITQIVLAGGVIPPLDVFAVLMALAPMPDRH